MKTLSSVLQKILSMLQRVHLHGFTIFSCPFVIEISDRKYAQILVSSGMFMIYHIEGHSSIYLLSINFCFNIVEI